MLKEETKEFLRKVPPFGFLSDQELDAIVDSVASEFYPRGMNILVQDGPPSEYLNVVKKGGVKVFTSSEEEGETVIDYRGEGESFGVLSLISGDHSRANVTAVDDTICYLIPRKMVLAVLENNPAANRYFLKSFFINFIDKTHDETRMRYGGIGEGDRHLFTMPVSELVRRQPVTTTADVSVRKAALIMADHRISSIVVVDDNGVPVGMVTDRDFREKVVARGESVEVGLREIMSDSLITVDGDDICFEALLKMVRHNIHHILVLENDKLLGLITNHDFMVLQGSSPTVLVKDIERARQLDDLRKTVQKVQKAVAALLREGAKAHNITGFITELVEKLVNRVVDLLESELGPPPVPYTLFLGGEGGRRELTLALDPWVGIVHEELLDSASAGRPGHYFKELAARFNKALVQCGCDGGREEGLRLDWVKSISGWRDFFQSWARDVHGIPPQADFFDIRAVRGEAQRVFELKDFLLTKAASNPDFLFLAATELVKNRPPLGFFKKFVVEKGGEHKDELNLFGKGIRPLAESVRLIAAAKGVRDASTMKRLRRLKKQFAFERANDIGQAIDYLLALLLHNQVRQLDQGLPPGSFVNPDELSGLEKKTVKESFLLTTELYDVIEKSYITDIVT